MGCYLSSSTTSWLGYTITTPCPHNPFSLLLLLHRKRRPQQLHNAAVEQFVSNPNPNPNHFLLSATTKDDKSASTSSRSSRSTRRLMLLLFPFLGFSSYFPIQFSSAAPLLEEEEDVVIENLEWYTDQEEGFALLRPSSWVKVDKAGATVLFEEGKGKNNIGVVVNPVRLSSLRDFGTPQFVADKLIQAERRKESTKDAEVVTAAERLGHRGLPVYEFEYTVDSTRGGMKRIFSAAFVASKKLYLLNIAYSDRPESPLGSQTRMVLEHVLHSFDTV